MINPRDQRGGNTAGGNEVKIREQMIKYLVRETRYTKEELDNKSDAVIERWYKEEKEVNKE